MRATLALRAAPQTVLVLVRLRQGEEVEIPLLAPTGVRELPVRADARVADPRRGRAGAERVRAIFDLYAILVVLEVLVVAPLRAGAVGCNPQLIKVLDALRALEI